MFTNSVQKLTKILPFRQKDDQRVFVRRCAQ